MFKVSFIFHCYVTQDFSINLATHAIRIHLLLTFIHVINTNVEYIDRITCNNYPLHVFENVSSVEILVEFIYQVLKDLANICHKFGHQMLLFLNGAAKFVTISVI